MAEAMDNEVGRLIAYLKETGKYDNTVFLFLSDNGALLGSLIVGLTLFRSPSRNRLLLTSLNR